MPIRTAVGYLTLAPSFTAFQRHGKHSVISRFRLFAVERFDFEKNAAFFAESKQMTEDMVRLRGHVAVNPHFVFLDRTRYGLLRLFESLRARVRIRNPYEWDG